MVAILVVQKLLISGYVYGIFFVWSDGVLLEYISLSPLLTMLWFTPWSGLRATS